MKAFKLPLRRPDDYGDLHSREDIINFAKLDYVLREYDGVLRLGGRLIFGPTTDRLIMRVGLRFTHALLHLYKE